MLDFIPSHIETRTLFWCALVITVGYLHRRSLKAEILEKREQERKKQIKVQRHKAWVAFKTRAVPGYETTVWNGKRKKKYKINMEYLLS